MWGQHALGERRGFECNAALEEKLCNGVPQSAVDAVCSEGQRVRERGARHEFGTKLVFVGRESLFAAAWVARERLGEIARDGFDGVRLGARGVRLVRCDAPLRPEVQECSCSCVGELFHE
jgi:hypothetical protein